jgi:hypothetical protein
LNGGSSGSTNNTPTTTTTNVTTQQNIEFPTDLLDTSILSADDLLPLTSSNNTSGSGTTIQNSTSSAVSNTSQNTSTTTTNTASSSTNTNTAIVATVSPENRTNSQTTATTDSSSAASATTSSNDDSLGLEHTLQLHEEVLLDESNQLWNLNWLFWGGEDLGYASVNVLNAPQIQLNKELMVNILFLLIAVQTSLIGGYVLKKVKL